MVSEEILEGLKVALSKGESLRDAMMSFYNAGYKKEEIEDAARALQMQQFQQVQPTSTQPPIKQVQPVQQAKPERRIQKPVAKPKYPKTIQKVSGYGEKPKRQVKKPIIESKPLQKVSSYEQKPSKPKGKFIIIFLIFFLVLLLGVLAGVFFFREELVEFFNRFF